MYTQVLNYRNTDIFVASCSVLLTKKLKWMWSMCCQHQTGIGRSTLLQPFTARRRFTVFQVVHLHLSWNILHPQGQNKSCSPQHLYPSRVHSCLLLSLPTASLSTPSVLKYCMLNDPCVPQEGILLLKGTITGLSLMSIWPFVLWNGSRMRHITNC